MATIPERDLKKYDTTVILLDGSVLHFRPIKPEDEDKLLEFFCETVEQKSAEREKIA